MRDEYRTIVEAGLDLQVDCPDLALSRHMLFTSLRTRSSSERPNGTSRR
jgi:hypothetical protein